MARARIIDGKALARKVRDELKGEVDSLIARDFPPNLVSLQVGESEPSRAYLESQKKACGEAGILYTHVRLDANVGERQLLAHVDGICRNPEVTGLIIQLPMPARLDPRKAYRTMDPEKDVEGMHPANMGSIFGGTGTALQPCTALAVRELILSTGLELRGAHCVVVGHSQIVGKPVAVMLLNEDATVSVCHVHTRDLALETRQADVLIVAVGKPGLVGPDMVKPGAVVIDVGMNYASGSHQPVGDIRFEEVAEVAGAVTPVPGGVGPMTVAMLLRNTVSAARVQADKRERRAS
jgi:methylenetetrahydrofolate dehydrogenase (NADP+) / methenyltetrahydrofolate cyclohydrolase